MKKFASLLVFCLSIISVYADHSYTGDIWDGTYNPDLYVGNEEYRYMVGGIYSKGNIQGIVYYIDYGKRYMKVSIGSTAMVSDKFFVYYDEAVEIYKNSQFNMITLDEAIAYQKNCGTIKYNRTWEWDSRHAVITGRYIWTSTPGKNGGVMVCGNLPDSGIEYYEVSTEDIHRYLGGHWGSVDVPFEPEYISEYVKL